MTQTISIEEAAAHLAEIISHLNPGEEITLTSRNQPVARIISEAATRQRRAGACRGMLIVHQEDESHLDDFKEYMQ